MKHKPSKQPKGFVREVRIPRLSLHKLQARIRQLETALAKTGELHARTHKRYETDRQALLAALKSAVQIIDEERAGTKSGWTLEDVRRIEAIRFLSLGV